MSIYKKCKAIFLDRDGVIIKDVGLITKIDQVKIYDYVGNALKIFKEREYRLYIVTNQAVIARGIVTEKIVNKINDFIADQIYLRFGYSIDKIYYCPHHPEANSVKYRINCECRKPRPGMLLKATEENNIDLSKSFMIGDRVSDVIAGYHAGVKTILLKTGKHKDSPIISDAIDLSIRPDFEVSNLLEAAKVVKNFHFK